MRNATKRRSKEISQPGEGMSDALGKAAFFRGKPVRQRARGGRKGCAFTQTEKNAAQDQSRKAADQTCEHCGAGPDDSADSERQARPESITQPSSPDLQRQIRPSESGEHPTQLSGTEVEVTAETTSPQYSR